LGENDVNDEKREALRESIRELFQVRYPDKRIEFAEDWDVALPASDFDVVMEALDIMKWRCRSKFTGWFWRWYYRARKL